MYSLTYHHLQRSLGNRIAVTSRQLSQSRPNAKLHSADCWVSVLRLPEQYLCFEDLGQWLPPQGGESYSIILIEQRGCFDWLHNLPQMLLSAHKWKEINDNMSTVTPVCDPVNHSQLKRTVCSLGLFCFFSISIKGAEKDCACFGWSRYKQSQVPFPLSLEMHKT